MYLGQRDKFANTLRECRAHNSPKPLNELLQMVVNLGASYLLLYKSVIELEGIFEDFLGVSEVKTRGYGFVCVCLGLI